MNVQEAKEALAKAELQEKRDRIQKELDELKKEYEGKCFASHTFQRRNNAGHIGAVYYERFYIKNDEIYVVQHSINSSKYKGYQVGGKSKMDKYITSFSRNTTHRKLTGGEYNASYTLFSGYSAFRKEISVDKFMELWKIAQDVAIEIEDRMYEKLPEVKKEWIAGGDHTEEDKVSKAIKELNLRVIDIQDYPEIERHLEYVTLPLFQNRRYLPEAYAKQILEWYIEELEQENRCPFATNRSVNYNNVRIHAIKVFITKLKL